MSSERTCLRVIVMLATLLSIGTTALAQIPFGGGIGALKEQVKERAFVKAATTLLNNDLPIILDATTALPAVDTLPGDIFKPRPLAVSGDMLSKPLPPGDYVVNVMAFCTEYSVHRPGQGVAYKLAPLKGHAAQAVSTLLWRGMKAHVPERRLMSLTWAIQSGLSISEMPLTFKADYDRLIPDYESDLSGDFIQELENSYKNASRGTKMPPLETLLGKMGPAGKTVLTAKRQREALLAQGQSDEVKEQTLFAGQESGVYTPVKAEEGPWTERIPGVAYMRYKIQGGNLASNNVMEIRIVGDGASLISMLGAQQNSNGDLTADGLIGYSQGQGAQALIPVLPSAPPSAPCTITSTPQVTLPTRTVSTRLGVGEVTRLEVKGISDSSVHWNVASGGGIVLQTGVYTAPVVAMGSSVVIEADAGNGVSCSIPLVIVQPEALLYFSLPALGFTDIPHKVAGVPAGHELSIFAGVFVLPGDVSFAHIRMAEFEGLKDVLNEPDGNDITHHLVSTPFGDAWYFACDTVATKSEETTSSPYTSEWRFRSRTGVDWFPFSVTETTWAATNDRYIVTKGQIKGFSDGVAVPQIRHAAKTEIPFQRAGSIRKEPVTKIPGRKDLVATTESCYQQGVIPLGFTEILLPK